jgi:glycine hydroxymethyltransferase
MREAEMERTAELIDTVLQSPNEEAVLNEVRSRVRELTDAFPLYPVRLAEV